MAEISKRAKKFFEEQYWYAKNFLDEYLEIKDKINLKILEVGAAEGGTIRYFYEKGHKCFGVEYSQGRVDNSLQLNPNCDIAFLQGDITNKNSYPKEFENSMDIVICRDVIEHIPIELKIKALNNMKDLLNANGKLFISFPPKLSPYAGHQQNIKRKIGKLPYVFLLPNFLYKIYLKFFGVVEEGIKTYLATKKDRLSIRRFEKLVSNSGMKILNKDFYFIRPNFEKRLNLKRKKQPFSKLFLREIFTLGAKYILTR